MCVNMETTEEKKYDDYMMYDIASNLLDYFSKHIGTVLVWGTSEVPTKIICSNSVGFINDPDLNNTEENMQLGVIEVGVLDENLSFKSIEILEIGLIESVTHIK